MDPIRRLILLGLVASVILTEPTQACALFGARHHPADTQPATATQRFIRQLAVVLRQTVKPAAVRTDRTGQFPRRLEAVSQSHSVRSWLHLLPHQFDLPPPLD